MKLFFPVLLAAAWIALVGMTLTDFAGFTAATQPCEAVASQPHVAPDGALAMRQGHAGKHPARAPRACP